MAFATTSGPSPSSEGRQLSPGPKAICHPRLSSNRVSQRRRLQAIGWQDPAGWVSFLQIVKKSLGLRDAPLRENFVISAIRARVAGPSGTPSLSSPISGFKRNQRSIDKRGGRHE